MMGKELKIPGGAGNGTGAGFPELVGDIARGGVDPGSADIAAFELVGGEIDQRGQGLVGRGGVGDAAGTRADCCAGAAKAAARKRVARRAGRRGMKAFFISRIYCILGRRDCNILAARTSYQDNPNYMLRNYLKTAFRNLWRNKGFSAINILGLTIGMASSLLIHGG